MNNSIVTAPDFDGENNNRNEERAPRFSVMISSVLPDGTMIETIYDRTGSKTSFAVCKDDIVDYKPTIIIDNQEYRPPSAGNEMLKKKVVLFPTKAEEYGSFTSLMGKVQEFIHKYLEVPEMFEFIVTVYVLLTWLYDKFPDVPYLRVLGDSGSGKTRFLQTVGSVCYKPFFAGGATTTSPIFRVLDLYSGVLILDEADFRNSDTKQDLIKILNNGYSRGFPVLRSDMGGKDFKPRVFDVYGPKVIANRGRFDDEALENRCLTWIAEPKTRKDIPLGLNHIFWEDGEKIRNQLLMFRFRNYRNDLWQDTGNYPKIEPRLRQITLPLLSIVEDEEQRRTIWQFIENYQGALVDNRFDSIEANTLKAYLEAIDIERRPQMKDIAAILNRELSGKDQITSRKVGHIIRYILKLETEKSSRGYHVPDSPRNRTRSDNLRGKYGIPNEKVDVEDVVDVKNGRSEVEKEGEQLSTNEIQNMFNTSSDGSNPPVSQPR